MTRAVSSAKNSVALQEAALSWIAKAFSGGQSASAETWLCAYARMQAKGCQRPEILAAFAPLHVASLPTQLLQFLNAEATPVSGTGSYYLGRGECTSYHDAIYERKHLLDALLAKVAGVPATINHIDQQAALIAAVECDKLISVNWDDAVVGPAGLSLAALFGAGAAPIALLSNDDTLKLATKQRHLRPLLIRYQNTLAEHHYASSAALTAVLPAAICAGAISALLVCTDTPKTENDNRKRVQRDLQARLSDLLDLCDLLALADRDSVLHCARDYYNNDRRWRAERLLRGYLAHNEDDAEMCGRLAWVLHKRGKHAAAIDAYQKALALDHASPLLYQQLGDLQLQTLQFEKAHSSFSAALQRGGSRRRIEQRTDWLTTLQHCEQQAETDSVVPALTLTASELRTKKWREEHLALGVKLFHRYGVLLIHKAFNYPLLEACNAEFIHRYAEYFTDKTHPNALRIGDKRYQISVALEGAFNNTGLYANPFIVAIMRRLLGDEFLLGCTVCATALPGAKGQHLHKDHRPLFADSAAETPVKLPPFAITTMVPLVTLDEKIGTTRVKKGSHLLSQPDSLAMPDQLPMVPRGSCFLMDLRLTHGGMANQTDRVRPIMNLVYQRYWFADSRNFAKHPPLRVSASEYQRIPQQHRYLFDWGTQPGPQVGR